MPLPLSVFEKILSGTALAGQKDIAGEIRRQYHIVMNSYNEYLGCWCGRKCGGVTCHHYMRCRKNYSFSGTKIAVRMKIDLGCGDLVWRATDQTVSVDTYRKFKEFCHEYTYYIYSHLLFERVIVINGENITFEERKNYFGLPTSLYRKMVTDGRAEYVLDFVGHLDFRYILYSPEDARFIMRKIRSGLGKKERKIARKLAIKNKLSKKYFGLGTIRESASHCTVID